METSKGRTTTGSTVRTHSLAKQKNSASLQQWQVSIQLLQLMQSDYKRARKQLEDLCRTLDDREQRVSEYLRSVLNVIERADTQPTVEATGAPAIIRDAPITPFDQTPQAKDAIPVPAPLEVHCFGSFEVSLGCTKLDSWHSLKAKLLLKYLITQGRRTVPKDVLMEALWPEYDPHAANNNLKAAMHALRRTLNPNGKETNGKESSTYVLFSEGNYIINPQADLLVDVDEFEHQWLVGQRLDREGKADEAKRAYELAEKLYRGDYLEENPYEEWTLMRREALKDIYLTILSKLSEHSIAAGCYENCIDYCHKILAKDPCREDAYRRLMICHSKIGQRSRGISWYKLCIKTLRAELDTTPDQQTTSIYDHLFKAASI